MRAPLDRSRPPAPQQRRPFQFPAFTTETWANGLRIYACPQREFPLLCIEAMSLAGAERDPAGLEGLASFHAELLDEGTTRRSGYAIAQELEFLGGGILTGCGWNGLSAEVLTLREHFGAALDVLVDCWRQAAFPEEEISRLRRETLADLEQRRIQPAALADDAFVQAVYRGAYYGRPVSGSPAALARIERSDLVAFRDQLLTPANTALLLVGDFDPDRVRQELEPLLAGWAEAPAPSPVVVEPPRPTAIEIHVVDRPGAAQTQLQIGQVGLPRCHPDFHALLMLNVAFGGKFTSRINLNLRERHGLTYSAYSHCIPRRGPGPFFVRTAVGSDKVGLAVREIRHELERICSEPLGEAELREAQDYAIGVFPSTVQTIHEIAQRIETLFFFGLADDYYASYPECLAALRPQDLLDVAQRHLHPHQQVVVAVGEAKTLLPQLEPLGPVKVHTAG